MEPTTLDRNRPSPLYSVVDRLGPLLSRLPLTRVELGPRALIDEALHQTGEESWQDEFAEEALTFLLRSLRSDAAPSFLGSLRAQRQIVRALCNNLRVRGDLILHPEIAEVPIRRPIFITGLPRTGTTLLHHLLAQDPRARVPLRWELLRPSPPPTADGRRCDRRIAATARETENLEKALPELFTIHPVDPTGPDECMHLLANSVANIAWVMQFRLPSYVEWLSRQNLDPVYRFYRDQLRLLSWKCPAGHWVLKSPVHLFSLPALLGRFPDASVIVLHRDPQKVVPSLCSMVALLRRANSTRCDLRELSSELLETLRSGIDTMIEARAGAENGRFFDMHYGDLLARPIETVRRAYRHLGYECTGEMQRRMERWLAADRHRARRPHVYRLEQFRLDPGRVVEVLGGYTRRFGIPRERRGPGVT